LNALILGCKSLLICNKKNAKRKLQYSDFDFVLTSDFFPVLEASVALFFPSIGPAAPFEMSQ
jgi:hypothetical protein